MRCETLQRVVGWHVVDHVERVPCFGLLYVEMQLARVVDIEDRQGGSGVGAGDTGRGRRGITLKGLPDGVEDRLMGWREREEVGRKGGEREGCTGMRRGFGGYFVGNCARRLYVCFVCNLPIRVVHVCVCMYLSVGTREVDRPVGEEGVLLEVVFV